MRAHDAAEDGAIAQRVLDTLRGEFIDEALETLDLLDAQIEGDAPWDAEAMMRATHSLKGQAGTYGFSTISLIAHLLETAIQKSGGAVDNRPQGYTHWIREILESGRDPDPESAQEIIDSLTRAKQDRARGVVVVVTPSVTTSRMCADVAESAGFQPLVSRSEFEALAIATQAQPVAVIAARHMGVMTAVEMAGAMAQIERLAHVPMVIVTGGGAGAPTDAQIDGRDVPVVVLGRSFANALTAELDAAERRRSG